VGQTYLRSRHGSRRPRPLFGGSTNEDDLGAVKHAQRGELQIGGQRTAGWLQTAAGVLVWTAPASAVSAVLRAQCSEIGEADQQLLTVGLDATGLGHAREQVGEGGLRRQNRERALLAFVPGQVDGIRGGAVLARPRLLLAVLDCRTTWATFRPPTQRHKL
jgi:hypothetical protein